MGKDKIEPHEEVPAITLAEESEEGHLDPKNQKELEKTLLDILAEKEEVGEQTSAKLDTLSQELGEEMATPEKHSNAAEGGSAVYTDDWAKTVEKYNKENPDSQIGE